MSLLCVAGGGAVAKLALAAFTLAWTHTVEKVPWQEDWRVEPGRLVLEEVRIKGSGAGMEPPPEARLEDGFYTWNPQGQSRARIEMRRIVAPGVEDWRLCGGGACRDIGALVPPGADPVSLYPCD